MKKIVLLAAIIGILQCVAQAQEQSVFTHYHINPMLINPATTGFNGEHQVFANLRHGWSDFPGAPKTYALSYNGPVAKTFGLGLAVYTENIASINRFRAAINYAFRYKVDKLKFGFGFTTEYSQWSVDNVNNNTFINSGDEVINNGIDGFNSFDASIGLYGLYNDRTYIGIAFPNIIMARLDDNEREDIDNINDGGFYMFNVGHKIDAGKDIQIEPSLMLRKARNVPFIADITLKGLFLEERLIGGLTYRTLENGGDALAILLGTKQKNFSFYYSFDVSFQGFQSFNNGSHEVTIGIGFPAKDRATSQEGTIEQLTN